ncbi:hypothetical protein HDV05_000049 [Chytridiales sp. JEL 0842]|nr:hypothetical protein HDV05_000049 [Chytridiales sp. JEL 0842]
MSTEVVAPKEQHAAADASPILPEIPSQDPIEPSAIMETAASTEEVTTTPEAPAAAVEEVTEASAEEGAAAVADTTAATTEEESATQPKEDIKAVTSGNLKLGGILGIPLKRFASLGMKQDESIALDHLFLVHKKNFKSSEPATSAKNAALLSDMALATISTYGFLALAKSDASNAEKLALVNLTGATVASTSETSFTVNTATGSSYTFTAPSAVEKKGWLKSIGELQSNLTAERIETLKTSEAYTTAMQKLSAAPFTKSKSAAPTPAASAEAAVASSSEEDNAEAEKTEAPAEAPVVEKKAHRFSFGWNLGARSKSQQGVVAKEVAPETPQKEEATEESVAVVEDAPVDEVAAPAAETEEKIEEKTEEVKVEEKKSNRFSFNLFRTKSLTKSTPVATEPETTTEAPTAEEVAAPVEATEAPAESTETPAEPTETPVVETPASPKQEKRRTLLFNHLNAPAALKGLGEKVGTLMRRSTSKQAPETAVDAPKEAEPVATEEAAPVEAAVEPTTEPVEPTAAVEEEAKEEEPAKEEAVEASEPAAASAVERKKTFNLFEGVKGVFKKKHVEESAEEKSEEKEKKAEEEPAAQVEAAPETTVEETPKEAPAETTETTEPAAEVIAEAPASPKPKRPLSGLFTGLKLPTFKKPAAASETPEPISKDAAEEAAPTEDAPVAATEEAPSAPTEEVAEATEEPKEAEEKPADPPLSPKAHKSPRAFLKPIKLPTFKKAAPVEAETPAETTSEPAEPTTEPAAHDEEAPVEPAAEETPAPTSEEPPAEEAAAETPASPKPTKSRPLSGLFSGLKLPTFKKHDSEPSSEPAAAEITESEPAVATEDDAVAATAEEPVKTEEVTDLPTTPSKKRFSAIPDVFKKITLKRSTAKTTEPTTEEKPIPAVVEVEPEVVVEEEKKEEAVAPAAEETVEEVKKEEVTV